MWMLMNFWIRWGTKSLQKQQRILGHNAVSDTVAHRCVRCACGVYVQF